MTHPPYPGPPIAPDAFPPPQQEGPAQAVASTRGLAIGAVLAAVVLTAFELIEVPLAFAAQDVYLDAADRGESSFDVFTAYDAFALPWFAAAVGAFVVACLWLYRVRTNAEAAHPEATHARKKGWVWAGWVVPVVSLWFPFQIVRDVIKAFRSSASTALVGWWWAFWILSFGTSQVGSRLTGFGEINTDAVGLLGAIEGVNAALAVVALVLWLAVIRQIQRVQEPDRDLLSADA